MTQKNCHGTGKSVKVAIVDDVVLAKIGKGVLDFDILISHPSFMNKLAKYAKVLGPKGLMPNPKAGTIGPEPEKLAEKFKKGTVRWKTEPKFPLIHQIVGKISLKPEQIAENTRSFIQSVGTKNITKAYIKLTMSPALQIDLQNI
ncbi:MAG: 50S ribosomal protein L1 [Candidatus Roizmanbacteria bacterium GW2011_GWA2_37_7]|uniref:Ribosomal protein n=1 Tax=Candidatus Roizmanbacteria bacterium GW2011_GWA2_37_7 TaxID=1618481 RepID=A0A0G0K7R4_9BACT|nr:MAG: 50S ribosomal protein L1 [Candidatus Roizmanbacteria bacterium GW2011_GWA2_37_7]